MKKKTDTLARIERLNAQMRDLAAWRLTALGRESDRLAKDHHEMLEAASSRLASSGPLAAVATRRIRALERRIEAANEEVERQAKAAVERASATKIAGRASGAALKIYAAKLERDELAELIERALSARTASPGQG